jgi:2-keto-4-pentenoate hydratase/2-oxohepta-3-ene-1,7-dioic acid hydratase in catechol pathway
MKLGRFKTAGSDPRIGIVTEGGVIDVARHHPGAPVQMVDLIEQWQVWRDRLQVLSSAPADHPIEAISFVSPVERPGKILGIGFNYADHAAEAGIPLPTEQVWFSKFTTALNGPFDPLVIPRVSDQLDYEAELVFVVGARSRYLDPEQAVASIFGYCVGNDVSVRDWQLRTNQHTLGKSFDYSAPIGPWIVTADSLDPSSLQILSRVNGEVRQKSNTRHLVFNCAQQLSHLSQVATMEPGDLIFTGTPGGVGGAFTPPKWLKSGDVVEIEIENIGVIRNSVVADR